MASSLNTSYAQEYVVVSKTANMAVLRVVDDSLYQTYWKEFISAQIKVIPPMYLRIEQVPPEITLVDQFSPFIVELPLVTLEVGDERINVTDRIAANTPNTEVPGLYRIDYRINISHEFSSPIWASYVSIQQRPILRRAAANWVRDSYIVQTLNRLVMEPQFMEALHAAGEPLYGFMEANQHPSLRSGDLIKYNDAQAWGAVGAINSKSNGIFITGEKLPQGSVVIYQRRMLQLHEPVWPDPLGAFHHMDPETHTRTPNVYTQGNVVRAGDASYVCINDADDDIPLSNPNYWRQGYLYKFTVLNGDEEFKLPIGLLKVGKGGVEHIWAAVDNQGYSFWVDILNVNSIGAYRGYYDRKNYADYGPDDIVSYIADDSVRLFKRKPTDIQDPDTLQYPPNHHLNPAWEEIYCHFPYEHSPLFSDYFIIPHTNATNAIMSKTWSVSEEMCQAYGNMMGIPPEIMKECGAKWSALLFALLSRTRNTFEGLRLCFRAVGLDVDNLHLSNPSIAYHCKPGDDEEKLVEDIYTQHINLRKLIAKIDTLRPEQEAEEVEGSLRYVTEKISKDDPIHINSTEVNVAIQQYSETDGWVTRYRFERIEPAQNFNNRYYEGDLDVLARLAEDAVKDLGDDHTWIKESAWAGNPSKLVDVCLAYEIPIYIYLRLKLWIYSENKIELQGSSYIGLSDGQYCGAKNVIQLFPTRIFSRAAHGFVDIPTGVFREVDGKWEEVPYTRRDEGNGAKIYEFTGLQHPLRIHALDMDNVAFIRYWQSTHTFGLLGLPEATSTINDVPFNNPDHFHNVTDPDITDETDLMLLNGLVGVTAFYRMKELRAKNTKALRWMYVLGGTEEEETWALSDTESFTGLANIDATDIYPFEGTVDQLKTALVKITDSAQTGGNEISFTWDSNVLVLQDAIPTAIYMHDSLGMVIGAIGLIRTEYTLTPKDWEIYRMETPTDAVRIEFSYG